MLSTGGGQGDINNMTELSSKDKAFLEAEGYENLKMTAEGGIVGTYKFLFTTGLMGGLSANLYDIPYKKRYCYPDNETALRALESWDGVSEPLDGWVKYKGIDGERTP